MESIDRFFKPPKGSFFLFGPRGTGKSTLCQTLFPEARRIDLLAPDAFRSLSARPERLRETAHGGPAGGVFVIDEIQKVPELLSVVHSLIEEKRGLRFVLTGSSSRKLKRAGVDLLAGRAADRTLHPFMAAELAGRFDLDRALRQGLLPVVMASADPAEALKAYCSLYLREEVQMEGLVRNVGNFSRFLEASSFSHAALLNVSNIARECAVERKTVEGYIAILEDLLLGFQVPIFSKRAKRALISHSKLYFCDAGVFRSLRPSGPLDRPEESDGQALEGLVAQHLRAWLAYREGEDRLYFWRTRSGLEVDFVVYGEGGLWAVEVKNSGRVRPEDLRALRAFQEDYPESRTILLYRGHERLKTSGVLCLPCGDFLARLRPDRSLDEAS
ncbi:MAG: AAA family ATPase [Elusimicrobiota bacterium]